MFTHILVPLDGSTRAEQVIPFAKRIALGAHARLSFVYVVDKEPYCYGYTSPFSIHTIRSALYEEAQQAHIYLTNVVTAYQLQELQTARIVLTGSVMPTLLDAIEHQHADLVILCSHGYTGIKRAFLGSVAQHLIRHSPVPLLLVRDGCSLPLEAYPDYHRPLHSAEIMVALDGSQESELALLPAIDLLSALTSPARGTIHLLCIVQPGDENSERYRKMNTYAREKAREIQTLTNTSLPLYVTWSVQVAKDIPTAIIQLAQQGTGIMPGGSDLLAMYSHDRTVIERLFHPSTTEAVFDHTNLPLFIVS